MTRVTSALVLAVLLGIVGVRLGCAWSCQPSTVTAAAAPCHETSVAEFEFSASAACNDVQSGSLLFAAVVRPDAATFVSLDRVMLLPHAVDDGLRSRPAAAHMSNSVSPPAFATPLRQ